MRKERPEELVERPSKSQLKREMIELQALGKKIIDLPEGQRAKFPLSDDMLAAIEETHRIRSHEGLRRHMQYVGKLMRKEDLDAVRAVFEAMEQQNVRRDASFQRLERWRDRLLDDDEAFVIFVEDYPHVDRQALRQLIRNARAERDAGKQPNSAKKLFKLLRAELDH